MTTSTAIGAWDDTRVFPMLRDYLTHKAPREPIWQNRHLAMLREVDPDKFSEMVTLANRFHGRR